MIEPARKAMQQGPLAGYIPYTRRIGGGAEVHQRMNRKGAKTGRRPVLRVFPSSLFVLSAFLAGLKPETLTSCTARAMSASATGKLTGLTSVLKENFDQA
jgi:hypothetical protein